MEKDQELLATAKTNNEFIRRLGELLAEQKTLEERKKEIDEIEVLLHRQKAATHEVHPAYRQWKTKADEILATKTEIERKKEKLTEAMETAQKRTGELSIAEQRRSTAEELQKKIDKINEEEEKYQQREKLGKMLPLVVGEVRLREKEKIINEYHQAVVTNQTQLELAKEDARDKKLVDLEELQTLCGEQKQAVEAIRKIVNVTEHRITSNAEK